MTQDRNALERAALAALELKNRVYRDNPYLWAVERVRTKDEASQAKLPFPDKPYIQDLFHALDTEQKIAVPKSRRMFASWGVATWVLHRIRYHSYSSVYWQSLQEAKSAFVVDERIKFIEDNLDPMYQKKYVSTKTKTGLVGKLAFPDTESYVLAIAQGGDQIRSFTPSVLVIDECEFQPESHDALKAALATVEKESKIILVSTSDGPGKPLATICKDIGFLRFP